MLRLSLLAAAPATQNLSIFDTVSPPADSIRNLSVLAFAVTGAIFLIVEGILIYAVLRFRRGNVADTGREPPQVYGSKPIEIAWTAAPALIVFVLVLVTLRTLWEVNLPDPEPADGDDTLFVTVVGHQWWWEYQYSHHNGRKLDFITANELHVPAGTPPSGPDDKGKPRRVHLRLQSADVAHSFWVPRLNGKMDVIPGRTNALWFRTDQPGLYVGHCAEFCGTQHANMLLRVYVDEPGVFDEWLKNQEKPAVTDPSVDEGKKVFLRESCVNCHRVRDPSVPLPAAGNYAPDLTHLMSRKTLAAGMVPNDPEGKELRRWVETPQKVKPGCLMPGFGLKDEDWDRLVGYLRTLE